MISGARSANWSAVTIPFPAIRLRSSAATLTPEASRTANHSDFTGIRAAAADQFKRVDS
ncbi:hypothetical protein FTUN_7745 [Frigoriglobus tundricola]|uniref:Uncharacterized protein n=1 Tax=Frigoriglobus tundricola TaxID=2774151 RepID=A0A6M5Z3M4_9BACT|nr:hypothetical protein FTUN_7745 [Frigoriglobus tundricola]